MPNKYETKFECAKRRSMDDLGFFRCPIENYILCNAYTAERCKECHVYKKTSEARTNTK